MARVPYGFIIMGPNWEAYVGQIYGVIRDMSELTRGKKKIVKFFTSLPVHIQDSRFLFLTCMFFLIAYLDETLQDSGCVYVMMFFSEYKFRCECTGKKNPALCGDCSQPPGGRFPNR